MRNLKLNTSVGDPTLYPLNENPFLNCRNCKNYEPWNPIVIRGFNPEFGKAWVDFQKCQIQL